MKSIIHNSSIVAPALLFSFMGLFSSGPQLVGQTTSQWSQFRGPDFENRSTTQMPGSINNASIAWKKDLPGRGVSGPITVDGRVFVSCSSTAKQNELHLFCFDAASGQELWHRQFWALGRCGTDPTSANAAPTPASDGKHVVAFYSSNDLACFDLDGNLKWLRALTDDYPKAANDVGMSSSPIIKDGRIYVQVENQGDSFAAAIDLETGQNLWKEARPKKASWSSPLLISQTGHSDMLVLLSADRLSALNAEDGKLLWEFEGPTYPIPSPAYVKDSNILLASINGLSAFRLNGSEKPEKLWNEQRLSPSNISVAIDGSQIITLNRGSVAVCADVDSAEEAWKTRIGGNHYSSPIIAGKFVYFFAQDGTARVVDRSMVEPEVVSEFKFEQPILGSPAADATGIYIRLQNQLVKLASQ